MFVASEPAQSVTPSADAPAADLAVGRALEPLPNPTAAGLRRMAGILVRREELWRPVAQQVLAEVAEAAEFARITGLTGPGAVDALLGVAEPHGGPSGAARLAGLAGWEAWLHVWTAGTRSDWHQHRGPTVTAVAAGSVREVLDPAHRSSGGGRRGVRHRLVVEGVGPAVTIQVYGLVSPDAGREEARACAVSRSGAGRSSADLAGRGRRRAS